MRRTVYIETSIASYLTARPSRDLILAGHQELTMEWWAEHRPRFHLYISQLVLLEAAKGDETAAAKRLAELKDIEQLELHDGARELARAFLTRRLIPESVANDALHVAIATAHGVDFLLTWNCKHIANAETIRRLEEVCQNLGYSMPVLCTPEQLMGH